MSSGFVVFLNLITAEALETHDRSQNGQLIQEADVVACYDPRYDGRERPKRKRGTTTSPAPCPVHTFSRHILGYYIVSATKVYRYSR